MKCLTRSPCFSRCDEGAIVRVLGTLGPMDVARVRETYEQAHGKPLLDRLRYECHGLGMDKQLGDAFCMFVAEPGPTGETKPRNPRHFDAIEGRRPYT